jgi:hypothetical protein
MKDYIDFLETKKKFEEAKLVYEKKKQKNIFEEEINKVKEEFLVEVDGMRKSMDELKNINSELTNKLENNDKIGIVFIGDGTLGEGVVYETLNLISLHPVSFV